MTIHSPRNFILPLAAALALLVNNASALTYTFNGGAVATTGNWDAGLNWVGGVVPTFDDTADLIFKATNVANRTTSLIATAKTVRSLTFNSNVTNNFEIRLTTGTGVGALNMTMGSATNAAAITVNSGAVTNITIGKGSGTTNGNLILANNLTVDQNSTAGTLTIDAPITETGGSYGLTKNGAGSLVLSSTNTYTGATTISGGELVLSGSGRLSASSALDLSGSAARLDLSGISAAGSTNASLAGAAGSVVNLGSKNLEVGGANTSTTFAGVLTNTGSLTKSGNGTLTLSGANTYTGATTVSAGSLIVNGSLGTSSVLTVDQSATFGGSGVVGGAATISGILSPGNSPGTLSFSNNLTLNSTAETFMEIGGTTPGTGFDQILVGGTLAYNGKLTIVSFGGWDLTQVNSYNLFDFAAYSGSFTNVNVGGFDLAWDGVDTWTGTNGGTIYSFTESDGLFNAAAVPEPSTYALLALSAAGFGWHVIRRRRR